MGRNVVRAAVDTVNLIIMGASTRAAAHSALRAGLSPMCLDRFGDADLQIAAPVRIVQDYPDELLETLPQLPRLPLIYVGGLENRPDILECAERHHLLLGNGPEAVRTVRNPELIADAIRLARVRTPDWRSADDPPPLDGTWLIRPKFGAGGVGISRWTQERLDYELPLGEFIFQKHVPGVSCSAIFLGSPDAGDVRFVGLTQQIIGDPVCHAQEFQWCGNIAPVSLSIAAESLIRRFGNILKWKLGLKGLYGVDFLIDETDSVWITDINPRYPASVELLEHITGETLLADHVRCFTDEPLGTPLRLPRVGSHFVAKGILYAPSELTIREDLYDPRTVPILGFPEVADLPMKWTELRRGDPVCTVYATGESRDEALASLQTKIGEVSRKICSAAS